MLMFNLRLRVSSALLMRSGAWLGTWYRGHTGFFHHEGFC